MPVKARPRAERFWEKVKKAEGDACWEWQGTRTPKAGYGLFTVRFHPSRCVVAHRISYELSCGEIPDGMVICHRCDNPPCVRPDHLFAGTRADNIEDMRQKGRASRGVKHFRARLNPDLVRQLRRRSAEGATVKEIAEEINVVPGTVYAVLRGKTWKHVPSE